MTATATTAEPTFYRLPAKYLTEGMSTSDGQDILAVSSQQKVDDRSAGRWCETCQQHGSHHTDRHDDFTLVVASVYTPADDEAEDNDRQCAPESRLYKPTDLVLMADFPDTKVTGADHEHAQPHTLGG